MARAISSTQTWKLFAHTPNWTKMRPLTKKQRLAKRQCPTNLEFCISATFSQIGSDGYTKKKCPFHRKICSIDIIFPHLEVFVPVFGHENWVALILMKNSLDEGVFPPCWQMHNLHVFHGEIFRWHFRWTQKNFSPIPRYTTILSHWPRGAVYSSDGRSVLCVNRWGNSVMASEHRKRSSLTRIILSLWHSLRLLTPLSRLSNRKNWHYFYYPLNSLLQNYLQIYFWHLEKEEDILNFYPEIF